MYPARSGGRPAAHDLPRSGGVVRRPLAIVASALTALLLGAGPAAAADPTTRAATPSPTATTGATGATSPTATGIENPLGVLQLPGGDGGSHVWVSDPKNGVCRMDTGADGRLSQNRATCVLSIGQVLVEPGQLAFDQARSKVFVPDMSDESVGVVRLGYDPAADGGRGAMSLTTDRVAIAFGCGLEPRLPLASVFGPDGSLYLGFARSPDIVRITTPSGDRQTCEVAGSAADGKAAYRLAFIGENLWEVDGSGLGMIPNARAAKGVKASPIMQTGAAAEPAPSSAPAGPTTSSSSGAAPTTPGSSTDSTDTATFGAATAGRSPGPIGGADMGTGALDPTRAAARRSSPGTARPRPTS